MGFSAKLLYDEVGVNVEPLSTESVVIFAVGPLTGSGAPCSSRTEITTRSPLTGNIGSGNTGGIWGMKLKQAGFDAIVVRNKAKSPVYIWIDDGKVELRDAQHLWGKNTRQTSDILLNELSAASKPDVSVLTIGPAGENLAKYAHVLNDYYHSASRCGTGAVMGSKKTEGCSGAWDKNYQYCSCRRIS
jgi:aldehyde:ferredoxin oxidoreductase